LSFFEKLKPKRVIPILKKPFAGRLWRPIFHCPKKVVKQRPIWLKYFVKW